MSTPVGPRESLPPLAEPVGVWFEEPAPIPFRTLSIDDVREQWPASPPEPAPTVFVITPRTTGKMRALLESAAAAVERGQRVAVVNADGSLERMVGCFGSDITLVESERVPIQPPTLVKPGPEPSTPQRPFYAPLYERRRLRRCCVST